MKTSGRNRYCIYIFPISLVMGHVRVRKENVAYHLWWEECEMSILLFVGLDILCCLSLILVLTEIWLHKDIYLQSTVLCKYLFDILHLCKVLTFISSSNVDFIKKRGFLKKCFIDLQLPSPFFLGITSTCWPR